ncbi:translocation/assembly module TamB domain-containing protein [Aurantiacibacter poecillastricola]|uniref:translocation/assembly module TamB domain-containing protein n=1 Tax=Aurantiacibacter poecillastricola TaxID=3064385 RepID=UPI00273FA485|nr:translocation/assembly module TamB domain-containing protein [Aurantiacibacter sp. 219JJ12-13]MDP5262852.1 translocation/assembly module TamB domain-containing protein [Aurantiacibacter sp. 219JJ12-13]
MADAAHLDEHGEDTRAGHRKRTIPLQILKGIGWLLAGILALIVLVIVFLHTPPGRQFIVDQIAKVAPASGLRVEVGEIDGSVLWSSTLYDVRLYDANDTLFLEVPTIDLNWRPHRWFTSGLDVRHLVLTDGILYAAPELEPGDPDAPILPDFDIRVDRFVIDDLTVAEGLLGEQRVIDFTAEADIRDGRVFLDADGEFGGGDEFAALVLAEPDGDLFDIDVSWQAPQGGFLATMVGAEEDLAIDIEGDGTWTSWEGDLLAVQGGEELLDFDLYNESGQYRLVGRARPSAYLEGLPERALGDNVMLTASGTLEESVLEGSFVLRGRGVNVDGEGAVDLADNRFDDFAVAAQLLDPTLFSEDVALNGLTLDATLDGPFRDLVVPHTLAVEEIDAGGIIVSDVVQAGTLVFDGSRVTIPLDAQVGRIVSGNELFDPRLVNGDLDGTIVYAGGEILSDDLAVQFQGLRARLGLVSDLETGLTRVNGPVNIANLTFDNVGVIDAGAQIRFRIGGDAPWLLRAEVQGVVEEVTNSTIANIAGEDIRFDGGVVLGGEQPLVFQNFDLNAPLVTATLDGRIDDDGTSVAGRGEHVEYGPFTIEATLADDGPRAVLVLANPLPAAGLTDVRVALTPSEDGFNIETSGGSLLGPFDGELGLQLADNGDTAIRIDRLDVADTRVSGTLDLVEGGVAGALDVSRGGLDGTIDLAVRNGGQGFDIELVADNARFGGETPILIRSGSVDASGLIAEGNTTVMGNANLRGLSYGNLFIGRLAAQAEIANGTGSFDAAITGQRGSSFELLVNGRIAPERIAVALEGSYAGRDLSMPRRAVLTSMDGGGWELQRSQISYGPGFIIASGQFGGEGPLQGRVAFSDMPLGLLGALSGDLGIGGSISGVVEVSEGANSMPVGEARLMVDDLTRSSLLLTSEPIDIALVADLSETLLQARAVMSDSGTADGRLQARIANLPQSGALTDRLYNGDLFGQFRFNGSAAALWRLAAIDLLDMTGDISVAANLRGSLGDPQVRGSLNGDDLRVRSSLTGTNITGVEARGTFTGSRLALTRFAGTAPNGGRVSGSGTVDLSDISAARGPQIDLRLAAINAEILDLEGMGATVTGPMRIVSNGVGGTIAGRLEATSARWMLGGSEAAVELPSIEINEVNLPPDRRPSAAAQSPWNFLIDVRAPGGIRVEGMGLDSEWRTENLLLRGTTDDPRVGGQVSIVPRQGFYSFAGTRFEITRGEIDFDRNVPIDPRIDLTAETEVNGLSVEVNVTGNASQPAIAFSSTPALPEEELLARLLFGGSITDLSATDALQLGAAVASLRGGGGVGPINQLRNAIGLDRLRIIPSDPALDRGTAVALGKNFGRRFYAEIITDGAGYNASELEFRVTSWLNLLATVSTIGRHQAAAEYRRDY